MSHDTTVCAVPATARAPNEARALPPKAPGADCAACPLTDQPLVHGRGKLGAERTAEIVLLGEAPGRTEVTQGRVFVGPAGQILARALEGLTLPAHAILNICLCYVPPTADKDAVTVAAATHCRARLLAQLRALRPKVIVTLGNLPTAALLGPGEGITKRRGKPVPWELDGRTVTVLPSYHPAAVLRRADWFQDLAADLRHAVEAAAGRVRVAVEAARGVPFARVTTPAELAAVYREVAEAPRAVLDLETSGLDMHRDRILLAVISTPRQNYLVPVELFASPEGVAALAACPARWVGHNAKFDRNVLAAQLGVRLPFAFDTMLASYLLDERGGVHGLEDVAATYLGAPDWKAEVKALLRTRAVKSYADLPPDVLARYTAADGHWTLQLAEVLSHQVARRGGRLQDVYDTLLMPGLHALSNAELRGVQIDRAALEALAPRCAAAMARETAAAEHVLGHDINLNSPQQVARALFDELGLPPLAGRSTNAKTVLAHIAHLHPFVDTVLRYRDQAKLLGTYVKGLLKLLSPQDTLHTNFNLHGTVTGRLSSSSPNLQNIPRDNADLRNAFVARPGHALCYADYSQLELRCIAWLSEDPFLLDVYRQGRDLHGEMAAVLFGPGYTDTQRSLAKRLNFGLVYGRSVEAMAADGAVEMTREEAARIQAAFFARMPAVVAWMAEVRRAVHRQQYVESPLGRRRRFPFLPMDPREMAEVYRQAVNMLPQSMASDLTLTALIRMDAAGLAPLLTVHDSILLEAPAGEAAEVAQMQRAIMEQCGRDLYGEAVPFVAAVGTGVKWGEIHV